MSITNIYNSIIGEKVIITINIPTVDEMTNKEYAYTKSAEELNTLLHHSLPRELYNQLLIEMLKTKGERR